MSWPDGLAFTHNPFRTKAKHMSTIDDLMKEVTAAFQSLSPADREAVEAVAPEPRPTSYPFLQCARRIGVDYATVLAYRSALIKIRAAKATHWGGDVWALDCWEAAANDRLHGTRSGGEVLRTLLAEEDRQRKVMGR